MEKLTRVLAVIERREECGAILEKASAFARRFGASTEFLFADSACAGELAAVCRDAEQAKMTLSSFHRERLPMSALILRRVQEIDADLVIKAHASAHPLHRFTLDDNDWTLANECPVPVLLVRRRPWSQPVRFAAAVDVSDLDTADVTRSILHTAGFLAMGFHGDLDILYSEREKHDDTVRTARAVRLAQLVREFHIGCERIQVLSGEPEEIIPPLAAARKYDVLVLGAQTRHQGMGALFGGLTGRMIEATPGDVVLVKAPAPTDTRIDRPGYSGRKLLLDEVEQLV